MQSQLTNLYSAKSLLYLIDRSDLQQFFDQSSFASIKFLLSTKASNREFFELILSEEDLRGSNFFVRVFYTQVTQRDPLLINFRAKLSALPPQLVIEKEGSRV